MPKRSAGYIVKRFHGGAWVYYAGANGFLDAIRWDSSISAAVVIASRAEADRLAALVSGFVQTAPRVTS